MTYYDSGSDPVDNSIPSVHHWKSTSSTGASTTVLDDLVIPSSPNFPVGSTGSPTRYMINLPGEIYYAGILAGTHPIVVANVDTTTILARVAPATALTANTYKVFPDTADTPGRMEIHVGTGSGSADDVIAYDGYFINSMLASTDMNNINVDTVTANSITASSFINTDQGYGTIYESTAVLSTIGLIPYIIEIGVWDMTSVHTATVGTVEFGTTQVRHVTAMIQSDTLPLYPIERDGYVYLSGGGTTNTNFIVVMTSGGFFNSASFDSTTINRGWVYVLLDPS